MNASATLAVSTVEMRPDRVAADGRRILRRPARGLARRSAIRESLGGVR
jgi:hypothetical protein